MTDPVVIAAFRAEAEAAAAREAVVAAEMEGEVVPRSDALPRLCEDVFRDGFDLIVARADADAAMTIIHRLWPDPPRVARAAAQCPACGATSIARLARLRVFVVVASVLLVLGEVASQRELFLLVIAIVALLLLIAKPMRCRTCGERWRGRTPAVMDEPAEGPAVICAQCGSDETEIIPRRRERAWTLLVNYLLPPLILVWPLRPNRRCVSCGHEWR